MEFKGLWERQTIDEQKMNTIRRDWTEGKVPDLPFVIIDQVDLRSHITEKLSKIDGQRMETTVIQAQYGDGKTNILKYLSLYFNNHRELNIHMFYSRADVEQTDFCIYLLQQLQDNSLCEIVKDIKKLRNIEEFDPSELAYNFEDDFAHIRDYTAKLFDKGNDDETLKNLIYLGTGRLYSKGAFQKHDLQQLTDFNRREIFVLFLNILAKCDYRVVFAVDELEKINDKSARRMAYFFSSYRELVDLFNKINGHYLITAVTNAVEIATLSQPLWGRIEKDVKIVERITKKEDLTELVELIAELLDVKVDEGRKQDIVSTLSRMQLDSNRFLIRAIGEQLRGSIIVSFEDELKKDKDVENLYQKAYANIEGETSFKNLSRIMFDPLLYYLETLQYKDIDDNLYKRDYQAFVDPVANRAFFFLFNDDTKIRGRVQEFVEEKGINRFVIFVPKGLTVNHSMFDTDGIEVRLIDYDPKKFFVLLDLYRKNFDKQDKLFRLIGVVTQNVFE